MGNIDFDRGHANAAGSVGLRVESKDSRDNVSVTGCTVGTRSRLIRDSASDG